MKKSFVGIMQPYFMPYVGYFQLMQKCSTFVVYDDVQFTKKGWINRNYLKSTNEWLYTINVKNSPVFSTIKEKKIDISFDRKKLIRKIELSYKKAPFFKENIDLVNQIVAYDTDSLFEYIKNSLMTVARYLEINETIIINSSFVYDTEYLKGAEKIYSITKSLNAENYLNPISGRDLYSKIEFKDNGLNLYLFSPEIGDSTNLSIIDTLFIKGRENTITLSRKGSIIES